MNVNQAAALGAVFGIGVAGATTAALKPIVDRHPTSPTLDRALMWTSITGGVIGVGGGLHSMSSSSLSARSGFLGAATFLGGIGTLLGVAWLTHDLPPVDRSRR